MRWIGLPVRVPFALVLILVLALAWLLTGILTAVFFSEWETFGVTEDMRGLLRWLWKGTTSYHYQPGDHYPGY